MADHVNLRISTTPRSPTSNTFIALVSTRHSPSSTNEHGTSTLKSIAKEDTEWGCKKCTRLFVNMLFSWCTKQKKPQDIQAHVLGSILQNPAAVLQALNRASKVAVSDQQPKDKNIKNQAGESILYLLCKGEREKRIFTLLDGISFATNHTLISILVRERADLEVRDITDKGFLTDITPATRKVIALAATPESVRQSPSITFRGALEKLLLYSTVHWFDQSMKEYEATWIQDKAPLREEYLKAALTKADQWLTGYQNYLEYPENLYPLDVVIRYSCTEEWRNLLGAMLQALDQRREIKKSPAQAIKTQIDNARDYLITEMGDMKYPQPVRDGFKLAKEMLENCAFYKAQYPPQPGSSLTKRSPRQSDEHKK